MTDIDAVTPDPASADARPYPPSWRADVVVADGGTVHLRPIEPSDADRLIAFHASLSEHTRYLRYFSTYKTMPDKDVVRFTTVDHVDRVALVVVLSGDIIGVGRFDRLPDPAEAEVAFVVADAHQGRGIGSVLLEHLAAAARERGVRRFVAEVLAENRKMVRVFTDAGYASSHQLDYGVVHLEFAIGQTAATEAVAREREHAGEAASIRRLLSPRSVAVVGASTDASKIGNAVLRNLLRGGFTGDVLPIHPGAAEVEGRKAYASVLDVPEPLDLVVIAVPAELVGGIVEHAGLGSVTAATEVGAPDADDADMLTLVEALHAERQQAAVTFTELTALVAARGLFTRMMASDQQQSRQANTALGRFLSAQNGRVYGGLRFVIIGSGHARRFAVQPLEVRRAA